jgi:hypothetical protein
MPYLIDLPADIQSVVPEVILLKPLHTEFMVDTGQPAGAAGH